MIIKKTFLVSLMLLCLTGFVLAEDTVGLTTDDCIELGIKNNFDMKKSNYNLLNANESVKQLESQYEPRINLGVGMSDMKTSGISPMYGTENKMDTLNVGLSKRFMNTGGALSFEMKNEKTDSNSIFMSPAFNPSAFNPIYDSNLTFSYNQPLLKNCAGINDRKTLETVNLAKRISELSYRMQKDILSDNIEKVCLDLNFARKNLDSQKMLLKRSQELLKLNKRKFKDGLIEEVDIIATEAAITLRESSILIVEDSVKNAKDGLKTIMGVTDDKNYEFKVDFPENFKHVVVNENQVIEKALTNRTELKIAEIILDVDKINTGVKRNEKLPSLDLIAQYGLSNTGRDYQENYDTFSGGDYPTWYLGLNMSLSPFQKNSGSQLRQSENKYKKDLLDVEKNKQNIINECRIATRRINTQATYVKAAKKALSLQKKKLTLEEKKFDQGRSSVQWLLTFQDDLTRAEIEYHRALTDYYKAKSELNLVTGSK